MHRKFQIKNKSVKYGFKLDGETKTYHFIYVMLIVERQNGKRGLESGFGSAGYANGI